MNRFAFTGHYYDPETKLYNAKARYLDPELGRFLTQDSYLGEIDEPPSLHRYLYANANPARFVDPTGHAAGDLFDPRTYLGGRDELAGAWQGFKEGYFNAAVEQGETFTGLGKGAWGAAEGAVTGAVGLGITATELGVGAAQGAAEYAITGDPSKLHEVASEATAIGSAIKNEFATTIKVAKEAYKDPSLALDAATELGIGGTAEVLGGATFETATIVAGPKGAGATARVVKEGARRARTTLAGAGTRVRAALQSEVKVVPPCATASCFGAGGLPKVKLAPKPKRGTGGRGYRAQDTGAHRELSPRSKRAPGFEPPRFQSHHPIQQKWARENVRGYRSKDAPTILLETGKGRTHSTISGAQRRSASGAGNTLRQEFNRGFREMMDAGVDFKAAQRVMKKNYKYFVEQLQAPLD
jgi:RHS repeat-associated protein